MFYYLNGTVALMDANLAVMDCGGVGYACHCSSFTLSQLRVGQPGKLYTHCNIKEDAFVIATMVLYWPLSVRELSIPFIAAEGVFLLRWIMQTAVLNTSARRMGLHRFNMISILWFDITLPLVNLWMLLIPKKKIKW